MMRSAQRWPCLLLLAGLTLAAQEAQREAALGAALARETRQRTTPLASPSVRNYVERLGRRLAPQLPDPGSPYAFTVVSAGLDGSTHEPLALPGGYIFVPADLILAARNEAEVAGMLAHAMAHLAAQPRGRVFVGGEEDAPIPVGLQESRRALELDADRLAVGAMARAGYDPGALLSYVERFQAGLETRVANLRQAIRELPPAVYSSSTEFEAIQDEVRRLLPAPVRRAPSLRRASKAPTR